MALDALWALLIPEVLRVSEVQAPLHADGRDTQVALSKVSKVSGGQAKEKDDAHNAGTETPDTPPEAVRYQLQPVWALGCTLEILDTPKKNHVDILSTGAADTPTPQVSKPLCKRLGTWLAGAEQLAARTYYAHHFQCSTCIAAGRGSRYGGRCELGLALWVDYTQTGVTHAASCSIGTAPASSQIGWNIQ